MLLLALVWKRPERGPKLFLAAWILGWGGFSAWNGFQIAHGHRDASARLSRGDVETAEGVVTDLVPAPPEGGFETFRLGGRTFRLSDGGTTEAGLNRTSARGGPVRGGARLRIAFRGTSILRVEELDAAAAPAR